MRGNPVLQPAAEIIFVRIRHRLFTKIS